MAVTGVSPEFRESLLSQVSKIANSEVLRGSESLCHLLAYLAQYAISGHGSSAKEHQIATEVFGRSPDFDPRLDSTVRVQTSRLRAKLAEYYSGPGTDDRIVVEVPKGAYSLTVHTRPAAESAPAAGRPEVDARGGSSAQGPSRDRIVVAVLAVVCCLLSAAVVYLARPGRQGPAGESPVAAPPALAALWHPFFTGPERVWVVFSNAEFVGRPETGMRYRDPSRDKGSVINDHYTGIGEVMAIHEIDRLFERFRHGVLAKRGRLLTMDDVKNNDLVFVGSPSENLPLRDLPAMREFIFSSPNSGVRKGDLRIVNLHPAAGEPSAWFASEGMPVTEDYAVIGLMPGPVAGHWVMTLAGVSTIGTQAAVEYACSESGASQLVRRAGMRGSDVAPFEALLRVTVRSGVPVSSELVTLRERR